MDATKSAMLFSKSVILVEGMAELILYPVLAEKNEFDLDRSHVSLVKVDSSTFKHFIKLFGANIKDENTEFALNKRVACVTDADPLKKNKSKTQGKGSGWNACYPFEIGTDETKFAYRHTSHNLQRLGDLVEDQNKVKVFYNHSGYGKTLEYDLAWENSKTEFFYDNDEDITGIETLINSNWTEEMRKQAIVASRFLKYAENKKGELALELADYLKSSRSPIICIPRANCDVRDPLPHNE